MSPYRIFSLKRFNLQGPFKNPGHEPLTSQLHSEYSTRAEREREDTEARTKKDAAKMSS